jgi:predicted DNA-binding transcriptional regulator YafY
VSRTARLVELLVRVQTKPRFTAQELAEEYGVSKRTMLRDMHVLCGMGVPLRSTPGPGGGYSLPRGGRRLSPSLRVVEALVLIVSYEPCCATLIRPLFAPRSLNMRFRRGRLAPSKRTQVRVRRTPHDHQKNLP